MADEGLGKGPLEEAVTRYYDGIKTILDIEDFIEGPTVFAEKSAPHWKGK